MPDFNPGPASSSSSNQTAQIGTPGALPVTWSSSAGLSLVKPDGTTVSYSSGGTALSQQLPKTRAGIASVLFNNGVGLNANGVNNFRVAWIGDSIAQGGASNTGSSSNGAKVLAAPFRVTQMLAALGIPSGGESNAGDGKYASAFGMATYTAYDPKIVFGANWNVTSTIQAWGVNNFAWNNTTTSTTLTYTPIKLCDTYDIYYINAGNAVATATAGGQTINLPVTSGLKQQKITINGLLGQPLIISPQSSAGGNLYIIAIAGYRSDVAEVQIYNVGVSGAVSGDFVSLAGATGYTAPYGIWGASGSTAGASLNPGLTVIQFGANDWNTGVSLATFTANVQALINYGKLTGDVILLCDTPTKSTTTPLLVQQSYVAVLTALAASNSIPFIDNFTRWQSWELANALGYEATDGIHPLAAGQNDIASGVVQTLMQAYGPGTIANTPRTVLAQSGIPIGIPSSGSFANNGALTGLAAFLTTYPSIYLYFPAGAIAAGSAAGLYYTVMSSATAGTVYNNPYLGGTPTIPANPTPFVTTGPGAYAQTVGSRIQLGSVAVPANAMGINGELQISLDWTNVNTAGTKYAFVGMGDLVHNPFATAQTTNSWANANCTIRNCGVTNRQQTMTSNFGANQAAYGIAYFSFDTTTTQNILFGSQLQTAGTDWLVIESFSVKVFPN